MNFKNKKIILIQFSLILFFQNYSFSQNNSLSQLFYPNITLGLSNYRPASYNIDNTSKKHELTRKSISGIIPLRSEVQVGIGFRKKLDLKAIHTVLLANVTANEKNIDGIPNPEEGFKSASVGIIQLKASLRDRIWLYGGGIGITESSATFVNPKPFFWGTAARMHILGLHTQIIYGTAVVYNQKIKIVPIFGATKKFNNGWRVSGILPFNANVSKNVTEWFNMSLNANYEGYSAGYQEIIQSENVPRRENYSHVRLSLGANFHILKALNLSLEGGLASMRKQNTFDASNKKILSIVPDKTPYIGVSIRYVTSKSKLSSKFINRMGIGL